MAVTAPEFSRPVDVARLGAGEAIYDIEASEAERAALAERLGLVSLNRLTAHVVLRRAAGGMVRLAASLAADLVQTDVVTLDPLPAHLEDEFTLLFAEAGEDEDGAFDPDAETVETMENGRIDLGEAVAQQLSLAMDPYPRA